MLGEGVVFEDEDVGTSSTVTLCFIVKAGIGVSAKNHVASRICGVFIGVCGQVVEKLVHGDIGGFCGCGLLGTQVLRVARSLLSTARA